MLLPVASSGQLVRETFASTTVWRIALWSYALFLVHFLFFQVVAKYTPARWTSSFVQSMAVTSLQFAAVSFPWRQGRPLYNAVSLPRRQDISHRAAHAACSCEIRPQTGQLSLPSRSVATNSGGQQRGHRLNPNSPPSVAWAIRRSFSASQRNFPSRAGASPVAERISRAARTFSETTVIERSAECRASMSMIID